MLYIAAASWVKVAFWVGVAFKLKSSGSRYWLSKIVQDNFFLRLNQKNQKFMKNIGQANVFHEFPCKNNGKHWPGQCFP